MNRALGPWLLIGGLTAYLLTMVCIAAAYGEEEHSHRPQDSQLHEQFYNTWKVPNYGGQRFQSCCNKRDCEPRIIEGVRGRFYVTMPDATRVVIPDKLLEENQPDPRESPDGQSHVCIQIHYGDRGQPTRYTPLCAVRGGAI